MIAAGDLQEFVPFGRDHCKHHPNALNLQLRQLQPASELWSSDGAAGLVGSLQEVTIHEKQKESWQLRKGISEIGEEVDYDEELYVAGNMVIWSKGSKSQALAVYKAFTVDSPVQQALWCDFIISQDKSEKVYSLFGSSRVQYVVDHAMKIVFLNTDPSIVMTYDAVQNLHSVWALRRVKAEEENAVLKFSEQGGTPQNAATSSSLTAHLRSLSKGDSPVASPFQNYSSIHSQSRSASSPSLHSRSPSISNMAALSCVKFQESNDKTQLIFGSVTNIHAKDAAPVEKIDTMLVLEGSGNLVLYTGVVRVVLLSPVPELRDSSKLHDSLYNEDCTFQQLGTYIHSIRDPVHNRVTLELSNGSMVRITIPEIATSELVQTCLQAIKLILPKEIAVQMLVKWYNVHSAPGGPSYHSEWNLFVTCLMNMMGYNTDRLAWTRNFDFEGSLSPVIAPKKARPSETGSDDSIALYILGDENSVSDETSQYLSRITSGTETEEEDDGMNDMNQEVMSLIWSEDLRVQDVRRLLQSAHPVRVNVVQYPELSDHEFIEEKENRLLQLCQRTMALPVGRGMFTLFSYHPVPTEPLPIPKLNLTGRAPPRNTTVDLNSGNIDVPPNMTSWASFHNGVAAGLKIAPASQIDSAWIVYNKPKHAELANEYAGFLMALGLNGHLTKLATLNIHDYLTKGHEMTSIGLLLGVSAAKLGTMDMSITRLLSIHIPALLPPTSTELDVPHNVQVAAVVGIGLVYQGTAHRHTAEVLLAEIGRPPGPEMEYCTDRESYSLAAGLALGMVCLGEGDTINVDVTCPGATLALAMIYLKTNNRSIADWLRAPDTMYLLDFVKPEFLLLRTLARCLILWDDILPNSKWVDSNVPQIIRENSISLSEIELPCSEDLNLETLSQAHVYIIAGACLSLGFRFAGSENLSAFNCLHKFAKDFMTYLSAPNASVTGPYNLETCLSVVLLSLAMVMAGSGNLKVLQLCRFLHMKTGGEMNYGFHLAHHMALGLLFLGGGRYSLSTSNSSIAALLCALYPHFPAHSTDNRYHLQALRHLYVLAAEPRLLVPVDVDTNTPCYALLEVTYKGTQWYEQTKEELMAPTLLPELHLLKQPETISAFTSDPALLSFAEYFCKPTVNMGQKQEILDLFSSVLYECVTQETPEMLPAYIAMDQAIRRLGRREMSETSELWQIKLVLEFFSSRSHQERLQNHPKRGLFMNSEFLPVVKCTIDNTLDQWLQAGGDTCVHAYLNGQPFEESQLSMLACFLVYHSVPAPRHLPPLGLEAKNASASFAEIGSFASWKSTANGDVIMSDDKPTLNHNLCTKM
ncbi:Anaphase-promoting complex subunit 1 [Tupaia chinensis]|uniref:Anaphase-promoting complex subunit 1 n=1 Tax=Tupaia chinensis TaxID=246437 RepID=L9JQL9_TUPCH|nr:Anaphase-promoting complex subunit 1 [Tupaia chinensis]